MKNIFIVFILTLTLTACGNKGALGEYLFGISSSKNSLTDKDGASVSDCYNNFILKENAPEFWKDNNLPKGTTEFVCKDYKAYLPNKATDCQGRLLTSYPNGIMGFKEQHNFPKYGPNSVSPGQIVGYTAFTCQNGQVIPIKF